LRQPDRPKLLRYSGSISSSRISSHLPVLDRFMVRLFYHAIGQSLLDSLRRFESAVNFN
jgi:hypothetical protein